MLQYGGAVYCKVMGCFTLEYEEKVQDINVWNSDKMVRLLGFLVMHHESVVTDLSLCEMLWPEEGKNPIGALKNLIYRLRHTLQEVYGDVPFILTGHKGYGWNPQIPLILDAERFERCYEEHRYEEALFVYRGALFGGAIGDYWAAAGETYYHAKYMEAVKQAAKEWRAGKQYSKTEQICVQALNKAELDEEIHCLAIEAMCKQGKWKRANQYKMHIKQFYEKELGITRLPELEACFHRCYVEGQ